MLEVFPVLSIFVGSPRVINARCCVRSLSCWCEVRKDLRPLVGLQLLLVCDLLLLIFFASLVPLVRVSQKVFSFLASWFFLVVVAGLAVLRRDGGP